MRLVGLELMSDQQLGNYRWDMSTTHLVFPSTYTVVGDTFLLYTFVSFLCTIITQNGKKNNIYSKHMHRYTSSVLEWGFKNKNQWIKTNHTISLQIRTFHTKFSLWNLTPAVIPTFILFSFGQPLLKVIKYSVPPSNQSKGM